jgi:hypothetical protein
MPTYFRSVAMLGKFTGNGGGHSAPAAVESINGTSHEVLLGHFEDSPVCDEELAGVSVLGGSLQDTPVTKLQDAVPVAVVGVFNWRHDLGR